MASSPLYVSNHGGTINLLDSNNYWLYRVCTDRLCIYSNDLLTAKAQIEILEREDLYNYRKDNEFTRSSFQTLRDLVESSAAPYIENNFF